MADGRRGAVDPRLLKYARATRPFLVALTALGLLTALLIIAQALLLADVISSAFSSGQGLAQLRTPLAALLVVVLARGAVAWGRELMAAQSSARAKSQLRGALLDQVATLGPTRIGEERAGELAVLATRGVDALDAYFALYLPQLVLAVVVPLAVVIVIADRDWIPALGERQVELLILESIRDLRGVQILRFDRTLSAEGPIPEESLRHAHDVARALLADLRRMCCCGVRSSLTMAVQRRVSFGQQPERPYGPDNRISRRISNCRSFFGTTWWRF